MHCKRLVLLQAFHTIVQKGGKNVIKLRSNSNTSGEEIEGRAREMFFGILFMAVGKGCHEKQKLRTGWISFVGQVAERIKLELIQKMNPGNFAGTGLRNKIGWAELGQKQRTKTCDPIVTLRGRLNTLAPLIPRYSRMKEKWKGCATQLIPSPFRRDLVTIRHFFSLHTCSPRDSDLDSPDSCVSTMVLIVSLIPK